MNQSRTLYANGKLSEPQNGQEPDQLDITIDGTRILGGNQATSLSGDTAEHLPKSIHYRLAAFEPQPDGTCEVKYEKIPE